MKNSGGFTLVELLVVVLIIGVLTLIAVPQFNIAVEKSRAADAFSTLQTLSKAVKMYKLEHGSYPTGDDWDNLSITLPGGTIVYYGALGDNVWVSPSGQWRYYLSGTSTWANRGQSGSAYNLQYRHTNGLYYCQAYSSNAVKFELYNAVCKSLCGTNPQTTMSDRTECQVM